MEEKYFHIAEGLESELPKTTDPGRMLIAIDTKSLYWEIDNNIENRIRLNDLECNILTPSSKNLGKQNFSGTRGFQVLKIENNNITVKTESELENLYNKLQEANSQNPIITLTISLNMSNTDENNPSSHRCDNKYKINDINISTNTIIAEPIYPQIGSVQQYFSEHLQGPYSTEESYVRCIQYPEIGELETETYAYAFGIGNKSLGQCSFSSGAFNLSNGAYSFTGGRNNSVQYNGTSFGRFNQVVDQGGTALGQYGIIGGHYAFGAGQFLQTINPAEAALGKYNKTIQNSTLFTVGNGTSDSNRKNALMLNTKGDLIIEGEITAKGLNINSELSQDLVKFSQSNELPEEGDSRKIYCVKDNDQYIEYIYSTNIRKKNNNSSVWDGTLANQLSGEGVENDPFLISNASELAYAITQPSQNKYYKLTADIYLNDISSNDWKNKNVEVLHSWYTYDGTLPNPIPKFDGTFDGDGHIIYGLFFQETDPSTYVNTRGIGLFPRGGALTIKNLGIDEAYIEGYASYGVGILIGQGHSSLSGTIQNCFIGNNVIIKGYTVGSMIGGGDPIGKVNVINCYSLGTIEYSHRGGLIGDAWSDDWHFENVYCINQKIMGNCNPDTKSKNFYSIDIQENNKKSVQGNAAKESMPGLFNDSNSNFTIRENDYPVLKTFYGAWECLGINYDKHFELLTKQIDRSLIIAEDGTVSLQNGGPLSIFSLKNISDAKIELNNNATIIGYKNEIITIDDNGIQFSTGSPTSVFYIGHQNFEMAQGAYFKIGNTTLQESDFAKLLNL